MDPIEHSQVLAVLYALGPARCLEWGSGGSTKSFLRADGIIFDPRQHAVQQQDLELIGVDFLRSLGVLCDPP